MNTATLSGLLTLLLLFLVSACDSPNQIEASRFENDSVRLNAPEFLLQTKTIDQDSLVPALHINNVRYELERDGSVWQGSYAVNRNTSYTIQIDWIEKYNGRNLQLASVSKTVQVGDGSVNVSIASTDYDTSDYDEDGDGVSNYDERAATIPSNPYLGSSIESATEVSIPRIAEGVSPPVIDGQYSSGEWSGAVETAGNGIMYINNLMRIDEGNDLADGQPRSRWMAIHDGTYLYMMVYSDDNGTRQFGSADAWDDDNLNIYLDGDYSRGNNYDNLNDFHILIPLLDSNGNNNNSTSPSTLILQGVNSATLPSVRYRNSVSSSSETGAHGVAMDIYEVRLPIASLQIEIGKLFGMDVHIDDDDNGGDRDSKWGWFHPARTNHNVDNTYQSPRYMAPVALEH